MKQNTFSEAYPNKVSLSSITDNDVLFFEILNKYLIDHLITHFNESRPEREENQEIYTFKIPQPRHRLLDFFLKDIVQVGEMPWQLIENGYTNHKYKLSHGILDIVVKKNVTKDSEVLFYTSANTVLKLQNMGLTKSEALTAKVIESLGHYNFIVEERRIKSNIVTNKTDLKRCIVARAQHFARLLQPLERCISDYRNLSTMTYQQNVATAAHTFIALLEQEYDTLLMAISELRTSGLSTQTKQELNQLHLSEDLINKFLTYDHYFLEKLADQYKTCLERIHNFCSLLTANNTTSQEISNALQAFEIYELHEMLDFAQAQNDSITANADDSLFRGRLRDEIIEADLIVAHYIFDQINPITKEHQSDFRKPSSNLNHLDHEGENKVLYKSSYHVGRSKEDLQHVLLGITALDDQNKQKLGGTIQQPEVVLSPGWNNFSKQGKSQKWQRLFAWGLTTLCHAPLSIANLIVTSFTGQAPIANLMQKIEDRINKKFNIREEYHHNYFKFKERLGGNNLYTSTLIGRMFYKLTREVLALVVSAPSAVFTKLKEQFSSLMVDFEEGVWGKLYRKIVPQNRSQHVSLARTESIKNTQLSRFNNWLDTAETLNSIHGAKLWSNQVDYATVKDHLNPYVPHDLVSSLVNATTGFMELFKDGIFEKHPVTGFIAALAYTFGGFAVLSPNTLEAILIKSGFDAHTATKIIAACQAIGKPIAKAGTSQAIASGFTLAKMMGVTLNVTTQGFDSALAKIIQEVSKDPLLYGMGICVSYGFGHMVTDEFHIPYISSYFKEEIGSAPALGKIMIGAKLGMLSLEAALPEDEHHPSIIAEFIADVIHNTMLVTRIVLTPITLTTRPFVETGHQLTRGMGIVLNAINKLATVTAQVLLVVPKTLLEVGTTLLVNCAKAFDHMLFHHESKGHHEVIGAAPLITAKQEIMHTGSHVGLFFREHLSRKPERYYGHAVKSLDTPPVHIDHYAKILTKLQATSTSTPHLEQPINPRRDDVVVPNIPGMLASATTPSKTKVTFALSCTQESGKVIEPIKPAMELRA